MIRFDLYAIEKTFKIRQNRKVYSRILSILFANALTQFAVILFEPKIDGNFYRNESRINIGNFQRKYTCWYICKYSLNGKIGNSNSRAFTYEICTHSATAAAASQIIEYAYVSLYVVFVRANDCKIAVHSNRLWVRRMTTCMHKYKRWINVCCIFFGICVCFAFALQLHVE